MVRGFIDIEEATEAKRANPSLQIVKTDCSCCGKEFFTLKDELFQENIFWREHTDYQINDKLTLTASNVKCPHCGFAGQLTPNKVKMLD